MALNETKQKEMIDLFEEVRDLESQKKDAVSAMGKKIKDAKETIKQWAEKEQLDLQNVNAGLTQYLGYYNGKINWDDGEDEGYFDIVNCVIDAIKK